VEGADAWQEYLPPDTPDVQADAWLAQAVAFVIG
jgi:hypothetical protein